MLSVLKRGDPSVLRHKRGRAGREVQVGVEQERPDCAGWCPCSIVQDAGVEIDARKGRRSTAPVCRHLDHRLALMSLALVDYRRGPSDKYSWMPAFDWDTSYENERWWDEVRHYVDDPWFVQVLVDGVEVARVELDDPGGINPTYVGVPELGTERLEIQLVEVAAAARRRGIGRRVVRALSNRHPDRRLFAYSEQADGFWARLGWEPFYDPRPGPPGRTLFIQPAVSPTTRT